MADLVKHGELSIEQIAHIQKNILVFINRDTFWDKFCSHTSVPEGESSIEWRKLNVPKLSPDQIANLTEGVTPQNLQMEYVKFSVSPVDYGDWIAYTDKSKKYNYDDVVRDAKVVLSQRARDNAEIRKAMQFISGTCTMDLTANNVTDHFLKDLLKARTILIKNKIKPLANGKFGCILTPEQAAEVLIDYKSAITHTSEKEALINGYLGELGGFVLYECGDQIMYKEAKDAVAAVAGTPLAANAAGTEGVVYYTRASSSAGAGYLNDGTYAYTKVTGDIPGTHDANVYYPLTNVGSDAEDAKGYCLFMGKTEYGLPVQTISFGKANVEVIDKGLGSIPQYDADNGGLRPDALNQRGSVGFKVMGFAARILHDEALIRAEWALTAQSMDVVDSNRKHFVAKNVSPVRD